MPPKSKRRARFTRKRPKPKPPADVNDPMQVDEPPADEPVRSDSDDDGDDSDNNAHDADAVHGNAPILFLSAPTATKGKSAKKSKSRKNATKDLADDDDHYRRKRQQTKKSHGVAAMVNESATSSDPDSDDEEEDYDHDASFLPTHDSDDDDEEEEEDDDDDWGNTGKAKTKKAKRGGAKLKTRTPRKKKARVTPRQTTQISHPALDAAALRMASEETDADMFRALSSVPTASGSIPLASATAEQASKFNLSELSKIADGIQTVNEVADVSDYPTAMAALLAVNKKSQKKIAAGWELGSKLLRSFVGKLRKARVDTAASGGSETVPFQHASRAAETIAHTESEETDPVTALVDARIDFISNKIVSALPLQLELGPHIAVTTTASQQLFVINRAYEESFMWEADHAQGERACRNGVDCEAGRLARHHTISNIVMLKEFLYPAELADLQKTGRHPRNHSPCLLCLRALTAEWIADYKSSKTHAMFVTQPHRNICDEEGEYASSACFVPEDGSLTVGIVAPFFEHCSDAYGFIQSATKNAWGVIHTDAVLFRPAPAEARTSGVVEEVMT